MEEPSDTSEHIEAASAPAAAASSGFPASVVAAAAAASALRTRSIFGGLAPPDEALVVETPAVREMMSDEPAVSSVCEGVDVERRRTKIPDTSVVKSNLNK